MLGLGSILVDEQKQNKLSVEVIVKLVGKDFDELLMSNVRKCRKM